MPKEGDFKRVSESEWSRVWNKLTAVQQKLLLDKWTAEIVLFAARHTESKVQEVEVMASDTMTKETF